MDVAVELVSGFNLALLTHCQQVKCGDVACGSLYRYIMHTLHIIMCNVCTVYCRVVAWDGIKTSFINDEKRV